jgi:membrane-associated protease RseP (regulator of RpoE activity)
MQEANIQEIIYRLSYWIQVVRYSYNGNKLIIEGYLRPGFTLSEVEYGMRPFIKKIHQQVGFEIDTFTLDLATPQSAIPRLNLILFLLTILTTLLAGTLMAGYNPIRQPASIVHGVPFSLTLLLILGVHELGHFYFAKKHKVDATLPYFIPAPTFIGTFGAFIKMRSPVRQRAALLEIGAAGPIAGFLVALPALFIGLYLSKVVPMMPEAGIHLGDSLVMKFATWLVFPNLSPEQDILLHPVGFAAWIGMLVTMLNLLPIGQLDGGHIAYAALGRNADKLGWGALIVTALLGIKSPNWLVWAALVFVLVRVKHPPVYDENTPLTRGQYLIVAAAIIIFILTFIPVPFKS